MNKKNAYCVINKYSNFSDENIKLEVERLRKKRNELLLLDGYITDDNGRIISSKSRLCDGILGFAVGDALGVPIEFLSRERLKQYPLKEMIGYGSHYVSEGNWSDDTSLMLATMDSIFEMGMIDYSDLMTKYIQWFNDAEYTSDGKVFDIGITTREALVRFMNGVNALYCGSKKIFDNGNGSLMRILPIVYYLFLSNLTVEEEVQIINNFSSLTHAHEISCLGCLIFSNYFKSLLYGNNKHDALNDVKKFDYSKFYSIDSINVYDRVLGNDIFNFSINTINSSGYIVDTLEAVLWSTLNSNSYEESVLTAVNLGGDTDTIGALTGAINGFIYGREQIPVKWLDKMKRLDYLEEISNNFINLLYGNRNKTR